MFVTGFTAIPLGSSPTVTFVLLSPARRIPSRSSPGKCAAVRTGGVSLGPAAALSATATGNVLTRGRAHVMSVGNCSVDAYHGRAATTSEGAVTVTTDIDDAGNGIHRHRRGCRTNSDGGGHAVGASVKSGLVATAGIGHINLVAVSGFARKPSGLAPTPMAAVLFVAQSTTVTLLLP